MLVNIIDKFKIDGDILSIEKYGNGHINDTHLLTLKTGENECKYILQKINKNVFKSPEKLMKNFASVTEYLANKINELGGDPQRETLNLIKTVDGNSCYVDENGEVYRMMLFVKNSVCYDKVERSEQFYESAVAFGNFQRLLEKYPAGTLEETIVDFHNTPKRYENLMKAVKADVKGRAAEVESEINFAREREAFCYTLENARVDGKLPLRVTHNDTKLNNILFDRDSGKPICVIDLDTIMPGYSVNDFGDSIRFGASTAAEDERDLSKVNFDLDLYEMYVKGFIEGMGDALAKGELELLPIGAIMMTLECGMRFLTDYLEGDVYFKTSREKHNIDRARTQFKLVADMESNLKKMHVIVNKYSQKV